MKVSIATEIRQALGWSLEQADQHLKLAPGTWQRVEQRQLKLSFKQLFALGLKTLRATFGSVMLTEQQLDNYNAEMAKLDGLIVMLQRNTQDEAVKAKLHEAAGLLQQARNIIAK